MARVPCISQATHISAFLPFTQNQNPAPTKSAIPARPPRNPPIITGTTFVSSGGRPGCNTGKVLVVAVVVVALLALASLLDEVLMVVLDVLVVVVVALGVVVVTFVVVMVVVALTKNDKNAKGVAVGLTLETLTPVDSRVLVKAATTAELASKNWIAVATMCAEV